jgi:hypothetical protein
VTCPWPALTLSSPLPYLQDHLLATSIYTMADEDDQLTAMLDLSKKKKKKKKKKEKSETEAEEVSVRMFR